MKTKESLATLRALLRERGYNEARFSAADLLDVAVLFYTQHRAVDCDIENDGDMLLYQWGVYQFDGLKLFKFDITRQFIGAGGEDDELYQLSMALKFPVNEAVQSISAGNVWCDSPDRVSDFRKTVLDSAAFGYARGFPETALVIEFGLGG